MSDKIPTTKNGQAMYTIVKDQHQNEFKIVNFNNPEMVPNRGIIRVEAIRRKSRHANSSTYKCYRDKTTEIIWGIPDGYTPQGDIKFFPLALEDDNEFDLSIAESRKHWAVLQYHPRLMGSINIKNSKPEFKKLDVEADAVANIKNVGERETASGIIRNLSHSQMMDMARNCGGINTMNNSLPIIQSELYNFIDRPGTSTIPSGAVTFNRIWTMTNRDALTVFKRCLITGLVHLDLSAGYLWRKATSLGNSEATAVDFITKNHSLLMTMDTESKLIDSEFQMNATEEEKTAYITNQPMSKHDDEDYIKKNQDIERLMKANMQLTVNMEKVLAALEQKRNEPEKPAFPDTLPEVEKPVLNEMEKQLAKEAEELKVLQKYANGKGMKHAYVTKDKGKIDEWLRKDALEKGEQVQA